MKKFLYSLFLLSIFTFSSFAGDGDKIPASIVKKLDGSKINTNTFSNNGKPIIINFWATWCKPCKQELDAIQEIYSDWVKETGVKLIAISIDDVRTSGKVVTDVKTKGWDYEVYIDENSDFKRAMNVPNPPQTFLIDGNGKIVWSHNGYSPGDETILYENLKKVIAGEKIGH